MVVNLFLKLGTQLGGPSLFYKLGDSAGRTEPILGTMVTQLRRTEPILGTRGTEPILGTRGTQLGDRAYF